MSDPLLQISFEDPAKKSDYKFGNEIAKRIYKEQSNEDAPYCYAGRRTQWRENRLWAKGMEDMNQFKDFMSISGDEAYVNIDWAATKLGAKFVRVLVNSMMNNDEYPCVKAIDDGSINEKKQEKEDALYRMHDVENVTNMQQEAGMSLEPPDAYVPDSEQSADVYFEEEFKIKDEAEMEEFLAKVLNDNNKEQVKRKLIKDGLVVNCLATKIDKMENGYIGLRPCIPEALIYNFFHNENGKLQISYIGEVYSLKIKDLRIKWGSRLTEQEIFNLGKSASQLNVITKWIWGWQNEYLTGERPYDDYNIEVFDFEIMTADADYYTSKTNAYGKEDIQAKKGIPQPTSDKVTALKKSKNTVYRGVWAIKADKMLYWGPPDIQIRPYQDIEQALFSYTINVPNNDGEYVPSLFEGAIEPLREYALCKLKRKQLIANLRASGVMIDIASSRNIDLGNGVIEPMEVIKIYNQTGNVIWSSEGVNPNEKAAPPIVEMPNAGSIAQLNELCNIIDRCESEIRGILGVPLSRDGSDMPPRMGVGVVDTQLASSNNVTDDVYKAYLQVMEETLHKITMLKWDEDVIVNGDQDKMSRKYSVYVKMLPTQYEKQILEQNLQVAMKEGYISFKDVMKVRNIKNFKVAEMYMAESIEKSKQQQQQASQQMQEQNGEIQKATQAQAAEITAKEKEFDAMVEEKKQDAIGKQKKEEVLLTNILSIYSQGLPMPEVLQPLALAVLQNVAMPLVQENKQMTQQEIQAQQEQLQEQEAMAA